jgi:hypothetical protein
VVVVVAAMCVLEALFEAALFAVWVVWRPYF